MNDLRKHSENLGCVTFTLNNMHRKKIAPVFESLANFLLMTSICYLQPFVVDQNVDSLNHLANRKIPNEKYNQKPII